MSPSLQRPKETAWKKRSWQTPPPTARINNGGLLELQHTPMLGPVGTKERTSFLTTVHWIEPQHYVKMMQTWEDHNWQRHCNATNAQDKHCTASQHVRAILAPGHKNVNIWNLPMVVKHVNVVHSWMHKFGCGDTSEKCHQQRKILQCHHKWTPARNPQ